MTYSDLGDLMDVADGIMNTLKPVSDWTYSWAKGFDPLYNPMSDSSIPMLPKPPSTLADSYQVPIVIGGVILIGLAVLSWRL
jgi:hypothetical protein